MRTILVGLCAALALATWIEGSLAAEAKQAKKRKPAPRQTKRIGQNEIIPIVDGQPDRAVKLCQTVLEEDPDHLESLFNLTLAWAQLGEKEKAVATMRRAIEAGLPPGRFLAGPRRLVKPIADTPEFRRLAADMAGKLIHGPMLGCVTDRGAKFWVRTAAEVPIQVVVSEAADFSRPIKSATVFTDAKKDFTAVAEVEMLEPDTVYYYDVLVKGKSALGSEKPAFRTFPPEDKSAKFLVGFGGGAGYTPMHERMWDTIAGHKPLAFLFLGDNVYIDNPKRPDVQHYTYYRRQSRPEYRQFVASTSIFAIWDDHDFGLNDCWGGPERNDPPWKVPVWRVFCNNWNNPPYEGGEKHPGCYFRFKIGDVDFFMLECRYWRTSPKARKPSMLGPVQKKWLLEELKHADGTFKVLASSVPWVLDAKGNSPDTWRGYREERDEIFAFLEANRIDGVILISADRHRSDVWRIDRPGAYPLWEFESSRLTNIHRHGAMPGSLFSYNDKCSVGLLRFDTTKSDPQVTYEIRSIDDEPIHKVTIKRSAISHK